MQFTIILGSILLVLLIFWYISKHFKFSHFGQSSEKRSIFRTTGNEVVLPQHSPRDEMHDDVMLGPVIQVEGDREYDDGESSSDHYFESEVEAVEFEPDFEFEEIEETQDQTDAGHREVVGEPATAGPFETDEPMDESEIGLAEGGETKFTEPYIEPVQLVPKTEIKIPVNYSRNSEQEYDSSDEVEATSLQSELEFGVSFPDFRGSDDRQIDVVGWLPENNGPAKRMDILAIYKSLAVKIRLPHSLIGLDVNTGKWINLEDDRVAARYSDLIFTMQLVHKGETVSERDWWQFSSMVEDVAAALSRKYYLSMTIETVLRAARALNEQIRALDLQAILILKSDHNGRISEKSMSYLAREYGLQKRSGSSIYDKMDSEFPTAQPLFSIVPMNETNVLLAKELGQEPDIRTLVIFSNLACAKNPRKAFDGMVDVAHEITDRLAVKLVDQNHNPVDNKSIAAIQSLIDKFEVDLKKCGITPGGDVASRLFNTQERLNHWSQLQGVVSFKPER